MSSTLYNPDPVDPDAVLDAHVRNSARAYRDQLGLAYEDPAGAYAAFRDLANTRGLGDAAIQMRENPEAFGTLRDGGADAAREAAQLGSRAYHAKIAQSNPTLAASVLDEALSDGLAQAGGEAAVPRLRAAWDDISAAFGPERGGALLRQRQRDFFVHEVTPEEADRITAIAAARDVLRERIGLSPPAAHDRSAPLPLDLGDEQSAPERLPERLQPRIVAAAAGMRARLEGAYEHPVVAEARLHSLVNQHGLAGIRTAERDPGTLGELRADLPGGPADAADAARAGLAYGRIAYQYHLARFPERAEEIAAREAYQAVSRSARDPERAMEGVQEAIQLRGAELEAHLARGLDRPRTRERGPDRDGPGGRGGIDLPPDDAPLARSAAGGAGATDAAVDEAVRALDEMEQAREELDRGRALREERASAERALARIDQQDRVLERSERDFRAVAERVYKKPDAAMDAWEDLVHRERGNLEAARERVAKDPTVLGPLRTEPRAGIPGRMGFTEDTAARAEVPRMLDRAVATTRARRETTNPVQWTTPEGDTVQGRDKVREAARTVIRDRTEDISAADGRVSELGGVTGSERNAQQRLDALTPAQRAQANARLAAKGRGSGAAARSLATGVVGKSVRAARIARDVGEGPISL